MQDTPHTHPVRAVGHGRRPALARRTVLGVARLTLLVLAACSGEDETNTTLGSGRHALSTTVFQPDGQTSLLGLVDDPGAPAVFDVSTALEIGGAAAIFGDDGRNVFALFAPYEARAWRWWSVDLESGMPAELVEDAPPRSASNRVLAAGGVEYIANLDPDSGTTTLMVPQADGRLTPGLTVTGYPYGLIRLR